MLFVQRLERTREGIVESSLSEFVNNARKSRTRFERLELILQGLLAVLEVSCSDGSAVVDSIRKVEGGREREEKEKLLRVSLEKAAEWGESEELSKLLLDV